MTRGMTIPETVTIQVPFRVIKRGGRKELVWPSNMPDGAALPRKPNAALVKALARAFRWQRMLESGQFTTMTELANREDIAPTYMTRVMRLSLLSPAMVDTILDGRLSHTVTLADLLRHVPAEWDVQETRYCITG